MPQTLLPPPQTLWEKARGLQSSFESKAPTGWKLVDKRSRKRVAPAVPLDQAKAVAPSAIAATADASAVDPPSIGSYVTTGTPCPASGWWRCEESHALDGTRWFAQGSLLPADVRGACRRLRPRGRGAEGDTTPRGMAAGAARANA
jgi:hypothetical protein